MLSALIIQTGTGYAKTGAGVVVTGYPGLIHRRSWPYPALDIRHETSSELTSRFPSRIHRRCGPQCHLHRHRGTPRITFLHERCLISSAKQYRWISHDFYEIRKLKIAYIVKGIIAGLLIILAIVFAVTLYEAVNVGAVVEWIIAFGYTLYLLTFFYDLRMAKGVHKGELDRNKLLSMQQTEGGTMEALRRANETGPNYPGAGNGHNGYQNGNGYGNGYTNGHSFANGYGNDRAGNRRW